MQRAQAGATSDTSRTQAARPTAASIAEDNAGMRHSFPLFGDLSWLAMLRRYVAVIALGNLFWEAAQLPLYTLWATGTWGDKFLAILHCTSGDILIAAAALLTGLMLAGSDRWPASGRTRVMWITIAIGIGYTIFSERLNLVVRRSWAYADAMPVVPLIGTGLAPLLQWVLIPLAAFWLAHRSSGRRSDMY